MEEFILPIVLYKEFDILAWWKSNRLKYLILQKVARDFLGFPISIIALELAFSIRGQFLSIHYNRLRFDTLINTLKAMTKISYKEMYKVIWYFKFILICFDLCLKIFEKEILLLRHKWRCGCRRKDSIVFILLFTHFKHVLLLAF